MTITHDIVQKLWNLCNVLKHDGVTYHQYVTELTYLLFLKMMQEVGQEDRLPAGYRWDDLAGQNGVDQLDFYRQMLIYLGSHGSARVQEIYANAGTIIKKPTTLQELVTEIGKLDWYSARQEGLGDLYEGLLQKNAGETKSGAGQYFTPRPLINAMITVMQPQPGEMIQDPAAGTGGFLIQADSYIKQRTDDLFDLSTEEQAFQKQQAFYGLEHVQDTHRLSLMNMMLHGIDGGVQYGDTLSPDGSNLPQADLVLTNPPFGSSGRGGLPTRDDFTFRTANKQLAFLQHIYRGLKKGGSNKGGPKKGGRAAVVLPDNVLFEDNTGRQIRRDLMDKCRLHTILRLPTGIFYAQGVKTNVLFFERGSTDKDNTDTVWVYDLRSNMPSFGKRTPLTEAIFDDFVTLYGENSDGTSPRSEDPAQLRWKAFTRADIAARGDNLDLSWLKDDSSASSEDLREPDDIAADIMAHLQTALGEITSLTELLDSDSQTNREAAE